VAKVTNISLETSCTRTFLQGRYYVVQRTSGSPHTKSHVMCYIKASELVSLQTKNASLRHPRMRIVVLDLRLTERLQYIHAVQRTSTSQSKSPHIAFGPAITYHD
jgi:hypothetical protein